MMQGCAWGASTTSIALSSPTVFPVFAERPIRSTAHPMLNALQDPVIQSSERAPVNLSKGNVVRASRATSLDSTVHSKKNCRVKCSWYGECR